MSESGPLRIAAIGCGLIAQTRHFQFLHELDAVHLEAVCDISPGTVEAVGERFGVAKRYVSHKEAILDPDVDAVAVFTYDHTDVVLDAIAGGKHVFVEKPIAFTPAEGRAIVDAAEAAGVVVMVGYMKIFDPAVEWAASQMAEIGAPRSVTVHDFGGDFPSLKRSDLVPVRVDDVPEAVASRRGKWNPEVMARVADALGESHAGYAELFIVLLMLGCHDLSVLRAVLGEPTAVSYAREVDPTRVFAVLEFEGGTPGVLEIGVGTKYQWWDEHLTVYGEAHEIRVEFDNPFVPFAPTSVKLREGLGPGIRSERRVNVGFDDGFRREWQHFADCVRSGSAPRSDAWVALRDIELCVDIIRAMPMRPQ